MDWICNNAALLAEYKEKPRRMKSDLPEIVMREPMCHLPRKTARDSKMYGDNDNGWHTIPFLAMSVYKCCPQR